MHAFGIPARRSRRPTRGNVEQRTQRNLHVLTLIDYLKTWLELKADRRAVTALEYALIAAVLVGTVFVGFGFLGSAMSNSFQNMANSINGTTS
jgi:pilus assembly protein Flp/PilA